jgi:diguanylate cyclase (GGDEF)-like protein/PAS domain S-box-containing protein
MIYISGILYFALAATTILLTSNGQEIATLWPANALLVGLMLQVPRSNWPTVIFSGFIANIMANLVTRGSAIGPALFGISNMAEVLIVAWGLHATTARQGLLAQKYGLGRFLLWGGLIGPGCSSVLGAATAWLAFGQPFFNGLSIWYVSDALGLLVFTPFFYSLLHGDFQRCLKSKTPKQYAEAAGLLALVSATALIVFHIDHLPVLFLVAIPVTLVTFRLGWLGTKLAVMIVAVAVAIASVHRAGPFMLAGLDEYYRSLFAQFYLASLLLLQMPIAAALDTRNRLFDQLARREQAVRLLAEQSEILILSLNRWGQFTRVIGATNKLIGVSEEQLLGHGFEALPEDLAERLYAGFKQILDYDCFDQALEFSAPGQPGSWREARYRVLEAERLADFEAILTIQDITDRKRREGALAKQAHVDGMTGLLNRAGFTDKAQRQIAQAGDENQFLVMIDVDRFKLINDNLGHAAGDAVLTDIAQKMKDHLRSTDIIGRLGGDEFAIILCNVGKDQAAEACDRLVASIAQSPVALADGKTVQVNISCGFACLTEGDTLEQWKHNADMALYEAKRGGRNKAVAA